MTADIARGQITGLIGLNGSGKTTLLRAVVGEYPYRGEIKFRCGHDHSQPNPEHVGYVPQRLTLDARLPLTVRDLFALALVASSAVPRHSAVGIGPRSGVARSRRDGGHPRQPGRWAFGRAVAARAAWHWRWSRRPSCCLLDEPAAGIDFKDQKKFYDLISRFNREMGLTVVLVSHDLNMVNAYADHVLCLKDGTIKCQGPPDEILTPMNMSLTFGAEMHMLPHHRSR